jgi:hypothetical protein
MWVVTLVRTHLRAHPDRHCRCISEKCRVPSDFERREVPLSAATGCEPSLRACKPNELSTVRNFTWTVVTPPVRGCGRRSRSNLRLR